MKQITKYFKLIAIVAAFFGASAAYAQCTASFVWAAGPNGAMTFTSTSTPTTASTSYYWNFGNSTTSIVTAPNNTASTTYPANGIYTVQLFYGTGTCSTQVIYTVSVNNVGTPTCNLNANFNASQGSNGNYNFSNTSTGTVSGTTYVWNFGDGSANSTITSPIHTYTANGTYTVTQVVNNNFTPACTATHIAVVTVSNSCNVNASFNFALGANGLVTFTSTSTGTLSTSGYYWTSFGASASSGTNAQQGSFTYTSNGVHAITLTVSANSSSITFGCFSFITQTFNVTNAITPTCNIAANFNYSQSAGTVNFNNTTTGTVSGVSYSWNFGDASTSTNSSPSHLYAANGTYTVTLISNNNLSPACVSTKTMVVNVNSICNLNAGFTYTLGANGLVSFGNTTTGTVSTTYYAWTFGDGGTSGNNSPSRTYTSNGTYNVRLIATNGSVTPVCRDTVVQTITISSATCNANSGFTLVPSGTPQYWYAVPSSSANISGAVWSWGDGSTSSGLFSSHTYSAAGMYTICLSVTVTCGASSTTCYTYNVYRSSQDNSVVHIDVKTADEIALGIGKNNYENMAYTLAPNPSNGNFNLNISGLAGNKATVSVYNIIGELVYSSDNEILNGTLVKEISLDKASKGVYVVKVSSENKDYTKKLIINK